MRGYERQMSSVQIGCRGASLLELALHVFSPAVYTVFFEAERIRQRKVGVEEWIGCVKWV